MAQKPVQLLHKVSAAWWIPIKRFLHLCTHSLRLLATLPDNLPFLQAAKVSNGAESHWARQCYLTVVDMLHITGCISTRTTKNRKCWDGLLNKELAQLILELLRYILNQSISQNPVYSEWVPQSSISLTQNLQQHCAWTCKGEALILFQMYFKSWS